MKEQKKAQKHTRKTSTGKIAGPELKEIVEEQQVKEMVVNVWEKAEEIKKQRLEEREKAKQRSKSKSGLVKPKWGER